MEASERHRKSDASSSVLKRCMRSLILLVFLIFALANLRFPTNLEEISHGTSFEVVLKESRSLLVQIGGERTKADKDATSTQSNDAASEFSEPRSETLVANDDTNPNSIPRRLIFTYSKNLLHEDTPRHLHDNVMHSIQVYGDAWGIEDKSQVEVLFTTDKECVELLKQVEPKFLPIFETESFPAYRGDICRVAALYLHGGYYLDVDIQALKALDPPAKVDFITAKMTTDIFFQAIIAATPRHPVIKAAMDSMLIDWYMVPSALREFNKSETEFDSGFFRGASGIYDARRVEHLKRVLSDVPSDKLLMGPATLRIAFDRQNNVTTPWMLEEIKNSDLNLYPQLIRKEGSPKYRGCNYIVHDPDNTTPYFYSRCRGTGYCP